MRKTSTARPHPKKVTAATASPTRSKPKFEIITQLLSRARGASVDELTKATGWQPHSIRGFLSGELKKKRQLNIQSKQIEGVLRHHLVKGR